MYDRVCGSGVDEHARWDSIEVALDAQFEGCRLREADEEGPAVFRWPSPRGVNGLGFPDEISSSWNGNSPKSSNSSSR